MVKRAKSKSVTVQTLERRALLSAGDLDPWFGFGGAAIVDIPGTDSEYVTAIDANRTRVVLGGTIPTQTLTGIQPARVALVVLDPSGKTVPSFSGDGIETELLQVPGGVIDLAVQSDNKIVVLAGNPDDMTSPRVLARFNSNGTLDKAFGGGDGQTIVGFGTSLALATSGRIAVAAGKAGNRVAVARFTPTGGADGQAFVRVGTSQTSAAASVSGLAIQSDGRLLVVGQARESNGYNTDGFIARVLPSGTIDKAFGAGEGFVTYDSAEITDNFDSIDTVALDKQSRIVIATRMAGGELSIERLLASGESDPLFAKTRSLVCQNAISQRRRGRARSLRRRLRENRALRTRLVQRHDPHPVRRQRRIRSDVRRWRRIAGRSD
jgi:uncharacterized delta-60 repeat protein